MTLKARTRTLGRTPALIRPRTLAVAMTIVRTLDLTLTLVQSLA